MMALPTWNSLEDEVSKQETNITVPRVYSKEKACPVGYSESKQIQTAKRMKMQGEIIADKERGKFPRSEGNRDEGSQVKN